MESSIFVFHVGSYCAVENYFGDSRLERAGIRDISRWKRTHQRFWKIRKKAPLMLREMPLSGQQRMQKARFMKYQQLLKVSQKYWVFGCGINFFSHSRSYRRTQRTTHNIVKRMRSHKRLPRVMKALQIGMILVRNLIEKRVKPTRSKAILSDIRRFMFKLLVN